METEDLVVVLEGSFAEGVVVVEIVVQCLAEEV